MTPTRPIDFAERVQVAKVGNGFTVCLRPTWTNKLGTIKAFPDLLDAVDFADRLAAEYGLPVDNVAKGQLRAARERAQ